MSKYSALVIGAGFGGLRTALSLHENLKKASLRETTDIFLLDRDAYEIYTPLLYKYAVSKKMPDSAVTLPMAELLKNTGIWFLEDTAETLDLKSGKVILKDGREVRADFTVLAPGSEVNYFDIPGLAAHSLPFKTFEDAKRVREKLNSLPRGARVLIGGGGPAGVELAAEIRNVRKMNVVVIEGAATLLPGFAARFSELAEERLVKLGVKVMTDTVIAEVAPDHVLSKDARTLPYDLLIWTGGVKVPGWIPSLPVKTEGKGRIEVAPQMSCSPKTTDMNFGGKVYALGDATCVIQKDGKPMPGVAPAAIDEGMIIARNIANEIISRETGAPLSQVDFHPAHYPYALPLGGRYAIASVGEKVFSGVAGWLFEEAITLNYLLSVMNPAKAVLRWLRTV